MAKTRDMTQGSILRDTFYKYAHYICRTMKERGLSYLIIGYNKGQKQGCVS